MTWPWVTWVKFSQRVRKRCMNKCVKSLRGSEHPLARRGLVKLLLIWLIAKCEYYVLVFFHSCVRQYLCAQYIHAFLFGVRWFFCSSDCGPMLWGNFPLQGSQLKVTMEKSPLMVSVLKLYGSRVRLSKSPHCFHASLVRFHQSSHAHEYVSVAGHAVAKA